MGGRDRVLFMKMGRQKGTADCTSPLEHCPEHENAIILLVGKSKAERLDSHNWSYVSAFLE